MNYGLFSAEVHLSLDRLDDWPLLRSVLAEAALRLTGRGESVRFVRTTFLPERGTLVCVFLAENVATVRGMLDAANLPALRIEPAIELPSLDPEVSRG
jgi:hypothetical protein